MKPKTITITVRNGTVESVSFPPNCARLNVEVFDHDTQEMDANNQPCVDVTIYRSTSTVKTKRSKTNSAKR